MAYTFRYLAVCTVSSSPSVRADAEDLGKTVIEAFPESEMAEEYRTLAKKLLEVCRI